MNYYIKEMTIKDAYDFMYVNTLGWNETYRGIVPDEFLDKIMNNIPENAEKLKNKFEDSKKLNDKRFLLYVNDEAVGVFGIDNSREEKYPNSGELCILYLLKKAQKHGYGKIMFEKAKEELRKMNYHDMIICCLKDNPTTKFYEYMGGEKVLSKKKVIGGKELEENIYYYKEI